jgi:hypothetical protein
VLLDFADDINRGGHIETFRGDTQGLIDWRQVLFFKFHVNHGADNLHDATKILAVCARISIGRSHTLLLNSS